MHWSTSDSPQTRAARHDAEGTPDGLRVEPRTVRAAPYPSRMSRLGRSVSPAIDSVHLTIVDADLRRLVVAWLASNTGRWAFTVVTWVLAYQAGGPVAVGILGLAQFVPQMLVAPFAGVPATRWKPEAVLRATFVIRILAALAAAAVIFAELPVEALFVVVAVEAAAAALTRPLHLALLPAVARTPAQLIGANVASSAAESLGTFVGPALVGAMLLVSGPLAATLMVAVMYAVGAAVLITLDVPLVGRAHLGARAVAGQLTAAVRIAAGQVGPRLVFLGIAFQTFVRGALGVLIVVVALELLGIGGAGVGTLTAAIGLGGLLGAGVATAMASGVRLGNAFVTSLACWGLPIAVIGLFVGPVIALVALFVVGISNAVLDVAVDTLLQRLVPHARQVAVIGLLELVIAGGTALGGLAAPVILNAVGIQAALVVTGAILPLVAVATWPIIRRVDESGMADPRRVALLRGEPLFTPLSLATVEHLAACLEPVRFDEGEFLIRQGEAGRSFYLIDGGSAAVTQDDRRLRVLGPGAGCGEIALLDDVPRTASVQAMGEVHAFSLERDEFLEAVTGHVVSRARARERTSGMRKADAETLALH